MLASICQIRQFVNCLKLFRQFVKCLFQSVNLFFYACKTLKPGFFQNAVDTNLFRLGFINPKKKFPDPGCWMPPTKKKLNIYIFLMGGFALHQRASKVWEFFLGLEDPSRNRLLSMAYQKKPGFSVLHVQKNKLTD